ncbi:hypothetical protein L6R52_16215 [Myxococcota bacterium]|nr:hypothetical protein [Myxococcota bacterium]
MVVVPARDASPNPPDAIAFVSGDKKQLTSLSRILKRAVGEVALAGSLRGIEDFSSFALVAVHYDMLAPDEQVELALDFAARAKRPTLLLLSERCAQRDFANLFESRALTNMLVINESGVDISDLLVTVQKIRRGEIFGLEKYFVWGVEPQLVRMSSSSQKASVLDTITRFAADIGVTPRLCTAIRTSADEFITNALYNAPVDASGRPRFAARPRTDRVQLEPGEEIEVRFCCDGRRFGLSTTDPFGSLAPASIQDYLARGFRKGEDQVSEATGGAGIGFLQILDSLSHFVVNIDPGMKTEMIGLVDVSGSYRDFAESGKSFNIFVKERS